MIAGTVLGEQSQSPGDVARVVTDLVSFTFPFSNKPLSFFGSSDTEMDGLNLEMRIARQDPFSLIAAFVASSNI